MDLTNPESWWGMYEQGYLWGALGALNIYWLMQDWQQRIRAKIYEF